MYPWAGFGGFQFQPMEQPLYGTDTKWQTSPTYQRQRPLGSTRDVITAMSIGSAERQFELLMSPDRYKSFSTLINTKGTFVDWEKPIPNSRTVFLAEVQLVEEISAATAVRQQQFGNTNGSHFDYFTHRRMRVRVSLISG